MHWTELNQIVAGDFRKGTRILTKGVFRKKIILVWGALGKGRYTLNNKIMKTELINKNNYEEPQFGWAILGGITAGPLGFLIGSNLGAISWEETICACYLEEGKKFLAVVSRPVLLLLQTEAFNYKKSELPQIKRTQGQIIEKISENKKTLTNFSFCIFCGKKISVDSQFCKYCGGKAEP